MNTYIKGPLGIATVRAHRTRVAKLPSIVSGQWTIVPATPALRREARLNVAVKNLRILEDGRLGCL
jgi:hypothetical protein